MRLFLLVFQTPFLQPCREMVRLYPRWLRQKCRCDKEESLGFHGKKLASAAKAVSRKVRATLVSDGAWKAAGEVIAQPGSSGGVARTYVL